MAVTLSYNGIGGEVGTLAIRNAYGSNTSGLFLTSTGANSMYITAGCEWQGNTSQTIARSATGVTVFSYGGGWGVESFTGATAGNAVTPTIRFYITPAGNAIVGNNASPNYRFVSDVNGAGNSTDGMSVYNTNVSGYGGALNFEHRLTASGSIVTASRINSEGGSSASFLRFFQTRSGSLTESLRIHGDGSLSVNTTTNSARLTIHAAGNQYGVLAYVMNATASTYTAIYGESQITSTYSSAGALFYSINANTYLYAGFWTGSAYWSAYGNGSFLTGGTYQTSDVRLKENIVSITSSLTKIKQLNPVEFDWKPNTDQVKNGLGRDVGLIAQEVLPIFPGIIREVDSPDVKKPGGVSKPKTLNEELGKWYTIEYTRLIPYVIQAIQELSSEVDTLKTQLATSQG